MKNLAVLCALLCAPSLGATQLFVSPTGSDANSGTIEAPFRTLEKARDVVRTLNDNMAENIVVNLRGGRYEFTETFVLGPEDSASNGFRIIYQGYGNEVAQISGGKQITGWTPVSGQSYFVADVPESAGFPSYSRQLYVNGVRAERARMSDFITSSRSSFWDDPATTFRSGSTDPSEEADGLFVLKSDLNDYINVQDLRVSWLESFKYAELGIQEIIDPSNAVDPEDDEVILRMEQPGFFIWRNVWLRLKTTDDIMIHNAFEELDEPGEWYLDRANDKIYYQPFSFENMATAAVFLPKVEFLVRVEGTPSSRLKGITLRNLTFEHGNWLAPSERFLGTTQAEIDENYTSEIPGQIKFAYTDDAVFSDNVVRHMGSCGVQIYEGCNNALIEGNKFYDLTTAGIIFGRWNQNLENYPAEAICYDGMIRNNIVRNIGRDHLQGTGISILAAKDLTVSHNDVSDISYMGIHARVAGDVSPIIGNIVFSHNKVSRTLEGHKWALYDSGQIYMHGRYNGSLVEKNYSLHAPPRVKQDYYSDNNSYKVTWRSNVARKSQANRPFYAWHEGNIDVLFDNNYSDRTSNSVGNATQTNFTYVQNEQWPDEAVKIMLDAGLEAGYSHLNEGMYGHENLATGKQTWSSSEYSPNFRDDLAVDGNWNTLWHTQSGGDGDAWWIVDLGSSYVIQRLFLIPRQNLYQAYTRRSFEIQGSNTLSFDNYVVLTEKNQIPWYEKTHSRTSSSNASDMWEAYIRKTEPVRYIRVKALNPEGIFNFAEIGVFGYGADSDGDGQSDETELILGTDPIKSDSSFKVVPQRDGGNFRLEWPTLPGPYTRIWRSIDLSDWTILRDWTAPAASSTETFSPPTSSNSDFFRIETKAY